MKIVSEVFSPFKNQAGFINRKCHFGITKLECKNWGPNVVSKLQTTVLTQ